MPRPRRHHSESVLPPAVNGIIAALTVAAISLLGMLVVTVSGWVLAADHSSLRSMFDVVVYGWLAIHLLPVHTEGGVVWLPPLLLTAGVVVLARAAGRSAARRGDASDPANRWRIIGAGVAVYAIVGLGLAAWSSNDASWVPMLLTPLATGAVFAAGFASAVIGSCGGGRSWRRRVPSYLISEGRAAAIGLGCALAAAAVAVIIAVLMSWSEVAEMSQQLRPGISGTVVLGLASVVYLPTAAIWALAFVAGPGVTLGQDGTALPWSIVTDELPAFPLLAAIPGQAHVWLLVGGLIPLAGGLVAAFRAPQPVCQGRSGYWASKARIAGFAGVLAGALATVANGSLGGRLSPLGPSPVLLAGAVVLWFLAAAALWWAGERLSGLCRLSLRGWVPARLRRSRPETVDSDEGGIVEPLLNDDPAEVPEAEAPAGPAEHPVEASVAQADAAEGAGTAQTPVDVSAALSALLAGGVPIVLAARGDEAADESADPPVCAIAVPESATVVLGRDEDATDLAPSTP